MAHVLEAWLRTRLGVMMDLTSEMFGRYTRDGTLLAQILHSYDIISNNQLSTILHTQDPALSRVNLRTLRIWLKLINVTLSDECIDKISKGKSAAALQLFYKIYLSLEGKDRLHFIVLQKEQKKKFISTSSRFKVSKVSEGPIPYQLSEHFLSQPLIEAADTILWHRNKFLSITEACRRERKRFEALADYPVIEPIEYFTPKDPSNEKEKENERLDKFDRKHPARKTKKKYQRVECCPGKRSLDVACVEDPVAAAEHIDFLKKRSRKAVKSYKLKLKTQTAMMTDSWERLLRKQDRSFDEVLGKRVLNHSRYEKQMMRKLCEVWDLRNRIVENRRIVDAILLEAKENEQRIKGECRQEIMKEEMQDIEMEVRRMHELRQRIYEEKMRRTKEKHRGICLEIVRDLADIAVKIAEYGLTKNNYIPHSWNKWKALFLKNQSIYEFVEHIDEIKDMKDEEKKEITIRNKVKIENGELNNKAKIENGRKIQLEKELKTEKQRLIQLELERRTALADADFENYRDLAPPWDEFVPEREEESEVIPRLGRIVLGYVVHRLLEILYPYSTKIVNCPVPRVKVAAVISGITNPILHEQLRKLLKSSGISLLKMEDAINHCLEKYKREMADVEYIDLNIVSATAKDIKRQGTQSKIDDSRDRHLKKIERTTKIMASQQSATEEKQTQTPRQIPYDDMDPILSDSAYIGKWTYEFLTLGQPISNELNTKILIEYLKEIGDIEGWVLINYPNTYEQMAMLEKALTGREVPFNHKLNFADVEDIDPPSPRIVFERNEIDAFAICRQSRLLPNPISTAKDHPSSSTTFITMYIKVMPKSKILDDQPCIPLSDDATSMDEYYANQSIAYGFFYSVLDLSTLKQLAEIVTNQFFDKKLFLEKFSQSYQDEQKIFIDSKAAIVKRLIPKSEWESSKCKEKKNVELEEENLQLKVQTQLVNIHVRPGEDGWQWIDFPQSLVLLEILATLWESIEEAYVENVKEILSLKRLHTSAIVSHKNFILNNLMNFINRPDNRQVLLQDFHRAFNEVDEDLRQDVDMKCELHCRVDDFRMELWELCDARRHEAEDERRRTLRNQWIPMEAVILVNVYINILQAEIDRFVDTIQLLEDYYISMSQKSLQESRFSKIILDFIDLDDIFWRTSSIKNEEERVASEAKADLIKASVRIVNMDHVKTEIERLLTDVSKNFDPDESSVYNIIKDNIRRVRDQVDSISSMVLEMLKKKEKTAVPETKGKNTENVPPDSIKLMRSHDLVDEWRYAVLFEIDRIHQRLNVLNAAARSDVTFLLNIMRQTFHRISHHIVERYKCEIESINEMANTFCFAIEKEKPIQQKLLFDDDQLFNIRSSIFAEDPKRFVAPIREATSPLRFRIVQLGRLIDIFQRIAPSGIMSERALVYVLQDLVSCGEEDCYPPYVPCAWRQLRPPDIEKLIQRLFGPTEYIEWREFILYAMDLPIPSHQDILKMRAAFRMQDLELKEVITSDQFHSTLLWFLEISAHKDSLNEELDYGKCDKITDIMLREEARLGEIVSNFKSDFIETNEDNISEILRLMLAKKLLHRMYLVNQNMIHYTAMLLSFCKDKDPREGLGKAFTLAMGGRVCTDTVKGERYVEELFEKRRAKKLKLSSNYLGDEAEKVAQEIISYIMNKIIKTIIILEKKSHDMTLKHRIHQLDEWHEINRTELLSPEVITEYLVIEDSPIINDEHEYYLDSSSKSSSISILSKNDEKIQRDERLVFWLPRDVCLTVLSTCLPWFASQANLFQTSMSLREGITHIYNELKDEELNDKEDLVLVHRLINHSFIRELFCASNKFVSKNMTNLLHDILKNRENDDVIDN